jgi:hypothetical protein
MSEFVWFDAGSTVPRSGKYECWFCREGGMADAIKGLVARELQASAKQESIRFFEAGGKFTECPNCGPATIWTFVEESPSTVQASQRRHEEVVVESGCCDICSTRVSSPDGYLLTTREVVSSPKYWQHYYQVHKSEFESMGVLSYEGFCRNPLLRTTCGEVLAGQRTPWMVCENCISMFDIDCEKARSYAKQWWQSGKTFRPLGTGSAPSSVINMGDARVVPSTAETGKHPVTVPTKRWWEFWKKQR